MSTAFGTRTTWNSSFSSSSVSGSSPTSSQSSSSNSSPSTSPKGSDSSKFNWMDAIAQLQSQITEESKDKRRYALYTIKEESGDELVRYKMK